MVATVQQSQDQACRNGSPRFGEKLSDLRLDALRTAPLQWDPFPFVVIPDFLRLDYQEELSRDFPQIKSRGSFPLNRLSYGDSFARLASELCGNELRVAIEEKFDLDLSDRQTLLTVRGMTGKRDGRIHADTKSKFVTLLLYLNSRWPSDTGRLRLLNNAHDLEDYVVEIPPVFGTCLIFKVTENCWHGHKPFVGERRALQLNYVKDEAARRRHLLRHNFTAKMKALRQLLVDRNR